MGLVVVLAVFVAGLAGDSVGKPPEGRNAGPGLLVANQLTPKGTPGSVVAKNGMYKATTLPPWEVEHGAIADPQYFVGRTATVDIFPGQQLTASDFTGGPVLVAKKFIPKGAPGLMAATNVISVPTPSLKEVEHGAIADPRCLAGRTATVDILPGQQLTVSDFKPAPSACAAYTGG